MVRFHLPKDRDTERIQLAMMFMCRDVKHCKNWMCEFCGERYILAASKYTPISFNLSFSGAPSRENSRLPAGLPYAERANEPAGRPRHAEQSSMLDPPRAEESPDSAEQGGC